MDGAIARTEQSGDDSELTDGLTRREHDILAFERQWWKYAGSKEEAIKELFSMSARSSQSVTRSTRARIEFTFHVARRMTYRLRASIYRER
jgi:Protein of unknown function (DUF3263)